MASSIDPTKPEEGNALTSNVRANFAAAKDEIEALQTDKVEQGGAASITTLATSGKVDVGDPGTEGSGINIGGVIYTYALRVNDIGTGTLAENILHRHSTTIEPVFIGARSNSNTSAHAPVTTGQGVLSFFGAGYTGSEYNLFTAIRHQVGTGTISDSSSPGKMLLQVTADGATVPSTAVAIDSDKSAVFEGTLTANGAAPTVTGSRGGNAALASLLTELATLGLIVDGTS